MNQQEDATHYEGRSAAGRKPKDPGPGKHLWIVTAAWAVTEPERSQDPNAQFLMDRENLITIAGPGCYKCELEWTPLVEKRYCRGSV